jgi:hypothetical protein
MRHSIPSLLLIAACASGMAAEPALPPGMTPEMMAKAMPGPEHAHMLKHVGNYDVAFTMWMSPTAPPIQSKAKAVFTSILGGRHLRLDYTGEFMGQPFTGLGIDSYDRVTGSYTSYWADNASTGAMYLKGTSTDGGKTINYVGEMSCPMEGCTIATRAVLATVDDQHFTYTSYTTSKGQPEMKTMELKYSKAK